MDGAESLKGGWGWFSQGLDRNIELRIVLCTVHYEIGRKLVPAGKVFRDTRVRSSMGRLDGSYAQYGAASAQIHDRDSRVRRDRMTV